MSHKKIHLPTKVCIGCDRQFRWRKKWATVWDEVKFCSERCRRQKSARNSKPRSR
ncbi:MAG: DUF2256 domain-containing protein [Planctomycetales bacterium]|nr:DUF2256 domain-containing protein [Planctomycetales bacterium]